MNMINKRIHSVFHEARPLDSVLISPIGDVASHTKAARRIGSMITRYSPYLLQRVHT